MIPYGSLSLQGADARQTKKKKVRQMNLEDYLNEMVEQLYQEAMKTYKGTVDYSHSFSTLEEMRFNWEKAILPEGV